MIFEVFCEFFFLDRYNFKKNRFFGTDFFLNRFTSKNRPSLFYIQDFRSGQLVFSDNQLYTNRVPKFTFCPTRVLCRCRYFIVEIKRVVYSQLHVILHVTFYVSEPRDPLIVYVMWIKINANTLVHVYIKW